MNEDEFRAKFLPQKGLCADCKLLPKVGRKARCGWCQLKKDGTDAEVAASYERMSIEKSGSQPLTGESEVFCDFCETWIPSFYMQTKTKCRGCHLRLSRDRRDTKTYGLEAGTRQQMYDRQDGKCYGCKKAQRFTGLAMHHDHKTGEPYYLACKRCNSGMGELNDDPQVLLRLAQGMLNPPNRDITGYTGLANIDDDVDYR